jgi:drug/metabolite transporter (DMT)-like permease
MSKVSSGSQGAFALTATVLCFAAAYPGIIAAQQSFTPAPLVLLRAILVTIALVGLAKLMQISIKISTKDLLLAGFIGQLGITGFQWLLYEAQQVSSAGTASTVVNMAPVITLIASAIILKEKIPTERWLGVLIAVIGVIVLGYSGSTTDFTGVPLLIIAAIGLGLYSVFLKPLVLKYNPLSITLHATWPGAIVFGWTAPTLVSEIQTATVPAWLGVIVLALIVSAGGYVAWARAVQLLEVSKAAIVYYLVPPVAVFYTFILFGERPLPLEYLGIAIVISGVAVALTKVKSAGASK